MPKKALTVPPPERVRALIELAAGSRSTEWATVITFAALTGMRRGELCGLRWSDVEWIGGAINVRRSIWQTKDRWA
ncbi:MAG TPA: tyrosine-type recombinase/integrase [Acidimicrobiales bacterium]|nr:tyrosine-type recombinase/integrase [Acidimicrobiales bacterium]